MVFLGIQITANPSIVEEVVDGMIKPLELELMKDDPDHFPTYRHNRTNWVEYSKTKSMSFGMPYEKYDSNAEWRPNGRLSFVFQVVDQDATKLFSLLPMAKEKNIWRDVFGNSTYQRERQRYRTSNQKRVLY